MIWSAHYKQIATVANSRNFAKKFIESMAFETCVELVITTSYTDEPRKSSSRKKFRAMVINISRVDRNHGPLVAVRITAGGILPEGIKHGDYTLNFDTNGVCEQFPPEMFFNG